MRNTVTFKEEKQCVRALESTHLKKKKKPEKKKSSGHLSTLLDEPSCGIIPQTLLLI